MKQARKKKKIGKEGRIVTEKSKNKIKLKMTKQRGFYQGELNKIEREKR